MTKLALLGVAAVAVSTMLAAPAFAQSRPTHAVNAYAQAGFCAGYEPGNPYNRETDYMGWSAWRVRGGWDATNDFRCAPTHMNHGEF